MQLLNLIMKVLLLIIENVKTLNIAIYLLGIRQLLLNLEFCLFYLLVSKGAKIRNRYNRVPHLTQDTNGKVHNDNQMI